MTDQNQYQHYVPVFHLAQFATKLGSKDPRSCQCNVVTVSGKANKFSLEVKNAKRIGGEDGIYTPYDTADVRIEYILSRIESAGVDIFKKLATMDLDWETIISPKNHHRLGSYILSLYLRHPANMSSGATFRTLAPLTQENKTPKGATADDKIKAKLGPFLQDLFDYKKIVTLSDATIISTGDELPLALHNPVQIRDNYVTMQLSPNRFFSAHFSVSKRSENRGTLEINLFDDDHNAGNLADFVKTVRNDDGSGVYIFKHEPTMNQINMLRNKALHQDSDEQHESAA